MDFSPPGSSVHGILQTRVLEWVAISFSRESSQPRDWTWVPTLQAYSLLSEPTRKAPKECLTSCSSLRRSEIVQVGSHSEDNWDGKLVNKSLSSELGTNWASIDNCYYCYYYWPSKAWDQREMEKNRVTETHFLTLYSQLKLSIRTN